MPARLVLPLVVLAAACASPSPTASPAQTPATPASGATLATSAPAASSSGAYTPFTAPDPDDPTTCRQAYSRFTDYGTVLEWSAPVAEEMPEGLLLEFSYSALVDSSSYAVNAWLWRDGRLFVRGDYHFYDPRSSRGVAPTCRLTPAEVARVEEILTSPMKLAPNELHRLGVQPTREEIEVEDFFHLPWRVGYLRLKEGHQERCFSDTALVEPVGPTRDMIAYHLGARVGSRVHHLDSVNEHGAAVARLVDRLVEPLRSCKAFRR